MCWYHRPSTPTGPLPKIGHTHFIFVLSYSRDELSHHTKFYQNRLKNKKVTTLSSLLHLRAAFVRKWKCLKLTIFQKDPSLKSLFSHQDDALWYFLAHYVHVFDILHKKTRYAPFFAFSTMLECLKT